MKDTEVKKEWKKFVSEGKECFKEFCNKKTRKKQIPNAFTASRLLAPFFIIPAALCGNLLLTGLFTCMFVLTDAADGFFARKYNATSEFGRKLDPITDKVFAGSLLIPLIISNPLMLINMLGEIVIALINTKSQLSNYKPKTLISGKVKTAFLYFTIALGYLNFVANITNSLNGLILTTAFIQALTASHYYCAYKQAEDEKKSESLLEEEKEITSDEEKEEVKELVKTNTREKEIEDYKDFRNEITYTPNEMEKPKVYELKK